MTARVGTYGRGTSVIPAVTAVAAASSDAGERHKGDRKTLCVPVGWTKVVEKWPLSLSREGLQQARPLEE